MVTIVGATWAVERKWQQRWRTEDAKKGETTLVAMTAGKWTGYNVRLRQLSPRLVVGSGERPPYVPALPLVCALEGGGGLNYQAALVPP